MSNASSIRKTKALDTASNKNTGNVRFNTTTNLPVYSDGSNWNNLLTPVKSVAYYNSSTSSATNAPPSSGLFYIATQPCRITKVYAMHGVTSGSTGTTLKIKKVVGTNTVSTGVDILSSGIATDGTAGVLLTGTLVTDDVNKLLLTPGDRLGFVLSAVGNTASLSINIELETVANVKQIIHIPAATVSGTGYVAFIAPLPCVITGVKCVYNTASTSGTLQLTKDVSTEAPGVGANVVNLLASTISLAGTANTVLSGTLHATNSLVLKAGDRISLLFGGTTTNLAGLVVALEIRSLPSNINFITFNEPTAASADKTLEPIMFVTLNNVKVSYISETHTTAANGAATSTLTVGASTALQSSAFALDSTANIPVAGGTMQNNVLAAGTKVWLDYGATANTGLVNSVYTIGYEII